MNFVIKIFLLLFLSTASYAQSTCGGESNVYRWGNTEAMTLFGIFGQNTGPTLPFDSFLTTPQIAEFYSDKSVRGIRCGLKVNLNYQNGTTHSSLSYLSPTGSFSTEMLLTKLNDSAVKFSLFLLEAPTDLFALDVNCAAGGAICAIYYSELDGIRKDTLIRFEANKFVDLTVLWIQTAPSDYIIIINPGPSEVAIPLHTVLPYAGLPFSALHIGKPNEPGTITGEATLYLAEILVR